MFNDSLIFFSLKIRSIFSNVFLKKSCEVLRQWVLSQNDLAFCFGQTLPWLLTTHQTSKTPRLNQKELTHMCIATIFQELSLFFKWTLYSELLNNFSLLNSGIQCRIRLLTKVYFKAVFNSSDPLTLQVYQFSHSVLSNSLWPHGLQHTVRHQLPASSCPSRGVHCVDDAI